MVISFCKSFAYGITVSKYKAKNEMQRCAPFFSQNTNGEMQLNGTKLVTAVLIVSNE